MPGVPLGSRVWEPLAHSIWHGAPIRLAGQCVHSNIADEEPGVKEGDVILQVDGQPEAGRAL